MEDIEKDNLTEQDSPLEKEESSSIEKEESKKSKKKSREQIRRRKAIWYSVRITLLAFVLGAIFAFIGEITEDRSNLIGSIILLVLLIAISIFFDGVGIAVTSCDLAPLTAMASKKVYGAKTAIKLVKNAPKVSSICSDLIGDTFGIISGVCATIIVFEWMVKMGTNDNKIELWITVAISAVVAALTIGGKSFVKNIAVNKSKEFTMFIAKTVAIFSKSERAILKNNRKQKNEEVDQ